MLRFSDINNECAVQVRERNKRRLLNRMEDEDNAEDDRLWESSFVI